MVQVVKAKLLQIFEQPDGYVIYIFQDLNNYDYIWTTLVPNWNMQTIPHIGDIGFLKYKAVEAGSDTWYDPVKQIKVPYKFTGMYFEGFILEQKPVKELTL